MIFRLKGHGHSDKLGSGPGTIIRPSSNKKLFPVHRPGGLKRAYWNNFFPIFNFHQFFIYFYFSPLYILVYKK